MPASAFEPDQQLRPDVGVLLTLVREVAYGFLGAAVEPCPATRCCRRPVPGERSSCSPKGVVARCRPLLLERPDRVSGRFITSSTTSG